jgi:hypothetical protein
VEHHRGVKRREDTLVDYDDLFAAAFFKVKSKN